MNNIIQLIDSYIMRCDEFIEMDGKKETIRMRQKFIDEVVSTFSNDIPRIASGLTMYPGIYYGQEITSDYEFTEDVNTLKSKLVLYRCKLLDSQDLSKSDKSSISQVNNNITLSNNVQVNISVYAVMQSIDKLEVDSEFKKELKRSLLELDDCKNGSDPVKLKARIRDVVKFVADKSADALICILPYVASLV